MAVQMTAPEMNAFLQKVFLEVAGEFLVEDVSEDGVVLRLLVQDRHLRPGGTVSGPAMFGLADVTAYMVTLAHIGPRALAVTTNCSIDFMRKPRAGVDLIAHGRLLKLGKQLSVTDALIYSDGDDKPVARASLTYAIPPQGVDLPA
ncbi:PaaI family thioesterase [uncultured Tateyamaria sp.]|uniref:PaaI family thioesterase n=1 Tax=uncultured Tateyamaria sp. TaxID=455651 RepID=UPI002620B3EC|nr:PaaI family thioesterase [uncultured Tateyamaria sp.]